MTPAQMSGAVRDELSSLSRHAKAELRAFLNNEFQKVCLANENEVEDPKLPQAVRANARLRNRIMREFIKDLDVILPLNSNHNAGLGARAEQQPEAHVRD